MNNARRTTARRFLGFIRPYAYIYVYNNKVCLYALFSRKKCFVGDGSNGKRGEKERERELDPKSRVAVRHRNIEWNSRLVREQHPRRKRIDEENYSLGEKNLMEIYLIVKREG